jgi:hypothetical protein
MTQRIRIGLAGAGRLGQIHPASLSARCPAAQLAIAAAQAVTHTELVNYTGQESRLWPTSRSRY